VREPAWQRLRRQRAEQGRRATGSGSRPDGSDDDELIDLDTDVRFRESSASTERSEPETSRQAAYQDWAERMRQKREQKQRTIRETSAKEQPATSSGPSQYWNSEALFEESRRVADSLEVTERTRNELLAVLGLASGATEAEVHRRYRQLAKLHHPDRFPHADDGERAFHADQMHQVNAAYRGLQDVGW
jgi:DnaJ-domain-containing protein 1